MQARSPLALSQARIDDLIQCTPHQVESRAQQTDREAGRVDQPPLLHVNQVAGCLCREDHQPPRHADIQQAEERQHGLGKDRLGDGEHHVEKREGQQIGYHVSEYDVGIAATGHSRGFDERTYFDRQCLGALIAGLPDEQQALYEKFGNAIGVAFQIYDDWLGVWGDPSLTGKSTTSDFLEKKKTLPVILGNELNQCFREAWDSGISNPEEGAEMAALLTAVGVEEKIMMKCERWTNKSVEYLDQMDCSSKIKEVLGTYANELLIRQK